MGGMTLDIVFIWALGVPQEDRALIARCGHSSDNLIYSCLPFPVLLSYCHMGVLGCFQKDYSYSLSDTLMLVLLLSARKVRHAKSFEAIKVFYEYNKNKFNKD